MSQVTTTLAGELLKRFYSSEEIRELSNFFAPCLERCAARGNASLGGAGFYFAVRPKGAHGYAYILESQTLPTGGNSTVVQAVVSPVVFAGVIEATGLAQSVSSRDPMAFARVFEENTQSTLKGMLAYKEGALFRDGSGLLATFSGNPGASAGPHTMSDVGFFHEGMKVDIIDAADNTRHHEDLEVVGVDWVNKQLTFTSALAAGVDDTDKVFLAESQAASGAPASLEPIGLEGALLDSGTYLGVSRSTYPNWKANVRTVSGFLSEDVLMRGRDHLTQETGITIQQQSGRFALVCHQIQASQLFKLAIPRMQFNGANGIDLLNSDYVRVGGVPVITSHKCPTDKAYLGDWSFFRSLYTPGGELHVDTEYNGSAMKWSANKDAGIVFLKEYHAFACFNPPAFVRYTSLSAPSR